MTPAGIAKRLTLEILGWVVLAAGVLALFLPGPGLLLTLAGLVILSTQYPWARRLLAPVRVRAWRAAAEGIATVPRTVASVLGALLVGAFGALWIWSPPAPPWWPVDQRWWLFGGPPVGVTLIISCVVALGLLVVAARRFWGKPHARAEVDQMEHRHRVLVRARKKARERHRRMRRQHGR